MARNRIWVGLDVGGEEMMACAIDENGEILFEQPLPTKAADLHALLKPRKRRIALIGLESGHYGTHLTRELRRLGYRVAVFNSRQASKFLQIRQNKTDRNDARGLAEVARLGQGSVSEVRVKSLECQRLRSSLVTRQRIVRLRVATEGAMRSLIRLNGGHLKSIWSASMLRRRVSAELERLRTVEKIDLTEDVEPLLGLAEAMRVYCEKLDEQLQKIAEEHPVCSRFLEIPGVGPICALSFYSAIEDPTRFSRNADVAAYLGMVPKVRQSGTTSVRLNISKMGSRMTRAHLVTAAMQHLRYADSTLQAWGVSTTERIGVARARVAVARKLAVTMIAIWKSGERYDPKFGQTGPDGESADSGLPIAA
jgi:transposase